MIVRLTEHLEVPLRLEVGGTELAFFATSATVETAADVTVDELRIETFYPADDATAEQLRTRAQRTG